MRASRQAAQVPGDRWPKGEGAQAIERDELNVVKGLRATRFRLSVETPGEHDLNAAVYRWWRADHLEDEEAGPDVNTEARLLGHLSSGARGHALVKARTAAGQHPVSIAPAALTAVDQQNGLATQNRYRAPEVNE